MPSLTTSTGESPASRKAHQAPSALPKFITIQDVADAIGCSRQSIYNMIARKTLPRPVKFGRNAVRFIESDVLQAIQKLRSAQS